MLFCPLQRVLLMCLWCGLLAGCSKEDLGKLANQAKNAVAEGSAKAKEAVSKNVDSAKQTMGSAAADVQETLRMAGSIQLNAGTAVKTDACYASFLQQGSGRPMVLQLRSYRDMESETFPSVFLQAQVRANSASELVNEPIAARLFVQLQKDGQVLFSEADKPVDLKITAVNDRTLTAELVTASLFDTATGKSVAATGQFEGVLPGIAAQ